jgi:hypothetical protein
MKRLFFLTTLMLLMSNYSFAGVLNEKGAYMGVALGQSKYEDDRQFGSNLVDDKDNSYLLYGGYRFLGWFAVEGRIANLGEFTVESLGSSKIEYGIFTANAVFILPFGVSGWEVFAQVGAGVISRTTSLSVGDDEGGVGTLGGGVRFTPIKNLSLALQVDGYGWEEEGTQDYDMGIVTPQIVIQYNF